MINRMLQQEPGARPSIGEVLASPALQQRAGALPEQLSNELSLRSLSLDCMEVGGTESACLCAPVQCGGCE